jgi:hypothetical protein
MRYHHSSSDRTTDVSLIYFTFPYIWSVYLTILSLCTLQSELVTVTSKDRRWLKAFSDFLFLGMGWDWVHLVRRPLLGLLYQPRMRRRCSKQSVESQLAEETEVLGETLRQCHFVNHKSHMTWPASNPDRWYGKPATNRLSYGTAD